MKRKVLIIGYGYVGQAMGSFFEGKYEVGVYDPEKGYDARSAKSGAGKKEIFYDLAVICVPTPSKDDGAADISAVEESVVAFKDRADVLVIKSTVPPTTTHLLAKKYGIEDRLCFSPEYIGEGNYEIPYWEEVPHPSDMKKHSFHIFGGFREATSRAVLHWQKVAGPFPRFVETDATTAELTKYMENAWIGTKVTFVNEFYEIAKHFGVHYEELRELWLQDGRVGRSHTLVYPDKRGFDGKCIPKDMKAVVSASTKKGYDPTFLRSALESNVTFRR